MTVNVYSNCSTITTGCFLYDNSNLTSPVANGKYSDGSTCYTVSGGAGEITAAASCSENVYFNLQGPSSADSGGDVTPITIASQSVNTYTDGSYISVLTNVTVYFTATGPFTFAAGSGTILSGEYCATGVFATGMDPFETIDDIIITSVSPSSSGTQNYLTGLGFRDGASFYTCPY